MPSNHARRAAFAALVLAATALLASACGGSSSGDAARLTLVAYSTPREAFEGIIPKFQATAAGRGVGVDQSYGPSGDQSRAVEGGLGADVVDFSLQTDMDRLVKAGLVAKDWSRNEHGGVVSDSVVVLTVRTGNPRHIKDWDDLLARNVEVVTPNPFSSGGARWNLMAAWGAWRRGGATEDEALDKLQQLLRNTPVQSKSAREALQVFTAGKGDVLISYENEAITAQQKGEDVEFIVPDSTILIENPAAVLSRSKHPKEARAFLDYLWSDEAQRVFGTKGYRPVVESVASEFDFAQPNDLFTIADLGGWDHVATDFFDRSSGKVAKIERRLGQESNG